MLKDHEELKFELLKAVLANPSNKITEIDVKNLSDKMSEIIQVIWKKELRAQSAAKL